MKERSERVYIIYTDGSTFKNGSPEAEGGFGVAVYKGEINQPEDWELVEIYAERVTNTTNNRMEMSAILWALEHYGATPADFFIPIVYTDSKYSLNSFTTWRERWKRNNWRRANGKEIENKDLVIKYDNLIKKKLIELRYVKGHSGNKGNELVDKLAKGLTPPNSFFT